MEKRTPIATLAALALVFLSGLSGCVTHTEDVTNQAPVLDEAAVVNHIPPHIKDREGWAEDIIGALAAISKTPTAERTCAVIAVIQQESGFQKNPTVSNLPQIVRKGLEEKFSKLGMLATPALAALLSGKAPGSKQSFSERIDGLRSERDLDRMFRDISATYKGKLPGTFAIAGALSMLLGRGSLNDLNPVTTAGSMQVKVAFARNYKGNKDLTDSDVREQLYTRAGGVRYGTARLIDFPAKYDDIIYRFADYNAGMYTSRNAAFQSMLSELTQANLTLDGDILAYDDDGDPKDFETNTLKALLAFGAANDISAWTVHRDARREKEEDFEETDSWKAVREAWEKKTNKKAPYAIIPNVKLNSPKLMKTRSTEWFASSVKRHYQACRARD